MTRPLPAVDRKGSVVIGTAGVFLLLFLAYLVLSVLVDLEGKGKRGRGCGAGSERRHSR